MFSSFCTFLNTCFMFLEYSWMKFFPVKEQLKLQQSVQVQTEPSSHREDDSSVWPDFDMSMTEMTNWLTVAEHVASTENIVVADRQQVENNLQKIKVTNTY